ncbi:MAG: hypothetical protein AAF429_04560 [Pseudomonadota bacterium]
MEFRIYLGPFETAQDHIYASLTQNLELFHREGIHVVPKEKTHHLWRILSGPDSDEKSKEQLYRDFVAGCLEGVEDQNIQQVVIFQPAVRDEILGTLRGSDLLPRIRFITRTYLKCIPQENLMFTSAIRAPSSFIPAIYARQLRFGEELKFDPFLYDIQPDRMLWSDTWHRLIVPFSNLHADDAPIYLWRYEDYPTNWRDVLATITGYPIPEELKETPDPIAPEISLYGAALCAHYIETKGIESREKRKEAFELFLKDYPDDGTIIKDPVWTPELIQTLNDAYADDWYFLERMDHVITI